MNIKKIIKKYFSKQNGVICVYLFGSAAVGKQNKFSDIDIAVLFSRNMEVDCAEKQLLFMNELSCLLDSNVDIVILNRAVCFIRFQIMRNGLRIYESSDRMDHEFEVRTFIEYFDFLPVKRKLEKALISNIRRT
ncbi:MAG: nucleotidyltransferase domain-containing protein [Candidatus Omnitrophota bacterium]